jgi:hypothetical protein
MRLSVGNETRIQVAMIEAASSAFDLANIRRAFKASGFLVLAVPEPFIELYKR